MFDALKRAANQKGVRDFVSIINPGLWRNQMHWSVGVPVFSADGKTVFFAANAGTGQGAAGNATWCLFACEVATGKLSVLSKLGAFFSRLPYDAELSRDGRYLVIANSVHSSAVENPVTVYHIDLQTQRSRTLLGINTKSHFDSNLTYGLALSPDGKHVAVSAFFFNTREITKRGIYEPTNEMFTLRLIQISNGRTVRTISGATQPHWN
jgi:hypothetical protein